MASTLKRVTIRSTDLAEVSSVMRATFGEVTLRPDERGGVALELDAVSSSTLTSTRWSMTGISGGTLEPDGPLPPMFVTGVRLGGRFRMWSGDDQIDCDRPFQYPDPTHADGDHPAAATLAISRAAVAAHAARLSGTPELDVRFVGTAPVDVVHDDLWRSTMAYTARTLRRLSDAPDSALVEAHLADLAIGMLLSSFPNTATAAERSARTGLAVRRAITYIDDHLAEPISIADIAAAAGLSRRGLYAAFERDLETTPMQYLRRARIAAAHEDLLRSDPRGTTVAAVAVRWGFTSTTSFTQLYRRTYGRHPRSSLLP